MPPRVEQRWPRQARPEERDHRRMVRHAQGRLRRGMRPLRVQSVWWRTRGAKSGTDRVQPVLHHRKDSRSREHSPRSRLRRHATSIRQKREDLDLSSGGPAVAPDHPLNADLGRDPPRVRAKDLDGPVRPSRRKRHHLEPGCPEREQDGRGPRPTGDACAADAGDARGEAGNPQSHKDHVGASQTSRGEDPQQERDERDEDRVRPEP